MSDRGEYAAFGEPDLRIAGLQLWVHARAYPDMHGYDDGNWLRVTVHCGGSGASVRVDGTILMTRDIAQLGSDCAAILAGERTAAVMEPVEPELRLELGITDRLGHLRARIELTPDHLTQAHRFDFEIDLSHLPGIVAQCAAILRAFPVRGLDDTRG